jgi:FtsP/CotA-like multicopper oxidase with cupredoxin domain
MITSTVTVRTGAAIVRGACVAFVLLIGMAGSNTSAPEVKAQQSPVANCPPAPDLSVPLQEIVSDGRGRTRGTMVLANGHQAFPLSPGRCVDQLARFYQTTQMPIPPPTSAPLPRPGPTIRARLGDVVELLFLNQVNVLDFGDTMDRWENSKIDNPAPTFGCDTSSIGYPESAGDTYPNCFHGSTSGNIHFHGTHTNPNGTGDNVFLDTRPSPWSNGAPVITEAVAREHLGDFFDTCERKLKADNLLEWPPLWNDLPTMYTSWQQQLLIADGQGKPPVQQLWLEDDALINATPPRFPQFFIGAFPTCFVLPKYPGRPHVRMGQVPGTHWYHAHKHGSTALNLYNGMSGALIIEGDGYDGFFDKTYAAFRQNTGTTWTRQQPTLVVNQYAQTPSLERGGGVGAPPLAVNGSLQPTLTMYPGQVQLWRIVNASAITGFYVWQLPAGFTWRQTAQDGVQFDNGNYVSRAQRPVYVGPANRIDLLVKAPAGTGTFPFTVTENTSVSEAQVASQTTNNPPVLFNINVAGSGQPMNLVTAMPPRPSFLKDIAANEVQRNDARTLEFDTVEVPGKAAQHTINGVKFSDHGATIDIPFHNSVGEWTITNRSNFALDHPFHIHVNPFQVVEVFDPHAPLLGPNGAPVKNANGEIVYLYMVATQQPTLQPGQCWVNPNDKKTWKPCPAAAPYSKGANIWWDVFPIPSAIGYPVGAPANQQTTIPGYFKMRTRFVDYDGSFVLHCHILEHEDRGMMFEVNVGPDFVNTHMLHR